MRFTALFLAMCAALQAHDIPNDVTVKLFFQPKGRLLNLFVRVPVRALRDIDFPQRGPGYLDLGRVDPLLADGARLWISDFIDIEENGRRLAKPRLKETRIALESDSSFGGPKLPLNTNVYWNQTILDISFEYPIESDGSEFSIHPALARLGLSVVTELQFLPPSGAVRAFEFVGDPGTVRLNPRWDQAAVQFLRLGVLKMLTGTDHLLFLLCVLIPFRSLRALIPMAASFTAALLSPLPATLWFAPLIQLLIAVSIVYMALENIIGLSNRMRRLLLTSGFGLAHGFGLSFLVRDSLQFAGAHAGIGVLAFNLGVVAAQVLLIAVLISVLNLLSRTAAIVVSAIAAHTAWHWMIDRGEKLTQFRFTWPELDARFLSWLALLLACAALLVLRRGRHGSRQPDSPMPATIEPESSASDFSQSTL